MQLNAKKCNAFICSHIFDNACLRRNAYCYRKRFETTEKLHISKTFLKMAGGRMHSHTSHSTPLDPSLAITKLQKPSKESGIFQSLGTISFCFLLKASVKKGGGGHGTPPL